MFSGSSVLANLGSGVEIGDSNPSERAEGCNDAWLLNRQIDGKQRFEVLVSTLLLSFLCHCASLAYCRNEVHGVDDCCFFGFVLDVFGLRSLLMSVVDALFCGSCRSRMPWKVTVSMVLDVICGPRPPSSPSWQRSRNAVARRIWWCEAL